MHMSSAGRVTLTLRRLPGNDLPAPQRATAGSSGLDLRACVPGPITLAPGQRQAIPTGFAVAIPPGYEAQVRPRSGLALEKGLTMLNTPGTIDADYRGEIQVVAINLGQEPVVIQRGDRIAQMVIQQVAVAEIVEAEELPATERGASGFGSSGRT